MRVLIVGLPLFAERLQKDLSEFDKNNKYIFLDTYYNKWHRIKALFLIPTVDVVYSINGTLSKSKVFDIALFFNKKVMMTWVGTDVLKAKNEVNKNEKFLKKVNHYCEVSWIQEELKTINIQAKILNFFNFEDVKAPSFPENDRLQILSYVSKGREEYYGWSKIVEVAKQLPEVDFTIVGTDIKEGIPENIKCNGWVENMQAFFENCHATIRILEHDGLSGFVLESLSQGKHVFYSEPLEHCIHVKDTSTLHEKIMELNKSYTNGDLKMNMNGVNYVNKNFNREHILSELIDNFKK